MASEKHQEEESCFLQGFNEVDKLILAFIEPMALKCILELRVPDIIHSHGSPMSLSHIATKIGSPSLLISYLSRVMRFLVHKGIFRALSSDDHLEETLYDLTPSSRLLLHDSGMTLAPTLFMTTHPLLLNPWQMLSVAIKDGKTVMEKAYATSIWDLTSANPELNKMFNSSMTTNTKFTSKVISTVYKDNVGDNVETLVDVGGGEGYLVSEIVKANWPRIKGINFDLNHVVEDAPEYPGVIHVGGDMFKSVPNADAIILKSVLHNWGDEDCKKILRNCKKALSKKGKLIVVGAIVQPGGHELIDDTILKLDLLMMVHCVGGRERTQDELLKLLKDGGFSEFKIIKTSTIYSIIEAYAS